MIKHILLVDDDADELRIFEDALRDVPGEFRCSLALNVERGMQSLRKSHPDFVFLDYNLPVLTGIHMLAEVKNDPAFAEIPFFLYSTTISPDIREAAMSLGAADCIEKPRTTGLLRSILWKVFVTKNIGVAG
jgi:CheY-like chemotaxis protein